MLELSTEVMHRLGASVLDQIVQHRAGLAERPASRVLSRRDADRLLDEPLPLSGTDPEALLERLKAEVFANVSHVDHPRFFAFVPGPGNFIAAMGAALAAGHNIFAGTWLGGSAAARLEQTVLDWLKVLVGFPDPAGGLFVSGGSMANLTAIGAARHARLGAHDRHGIIYFSDQTHSAVERALRVMGFSAEDMRRIPADPVRGLDARALSEMVQADRAAGGEPFCVVANAGTTNTGAVDPLTAIADLCDDESLWLHVDGAYGAAAVLGTRGRAALAGLDRADSIALDPHKWLFQPFECGCLLVRDAAPLRAAYAIHPEYMRDTLLEDEETNYCEYGVQLSRSFRALGLWLTLKTFG
ncbi:MAG: aminotransferase class V-fold PLP-dependent enzyme, partial [Rhodothermales bacterium]|nr:aminotransferase class V-fold PLP-dependent enzyme [Rhodothermales bacterium]